MNSRLLPLGMVLTSIFLAACGGRAEIRAENYDQDCAKSEDCATVLVGNPCECKCDTAAINKRDMDRYTGALDDIKGECVDELLTCTKCPELKGAVCTAGRCEVEGGPLNR